jgi:four helix bundle protein
MLESYRDLRVWQKSMDLVERVYATTEQFPRSELYGLTTQLRRAAVSIASNIAEGKSIGGQSYPRHLKIAIGSESELETQIELARRLRMLEPSEAGRLANEASEVGRMIAALIRSLPKD